MQQFQDYRILLVHPSRLLREGLRCIFQGTKCSIQDTALMQGFLRPEIIAYPDVVIWGPGIPSKVLLTEILSIRARASRSPTSVRHVVLTSYPSPVFMRRLARLDIEAVLHDDITADVLLRSIELVMLGQRVLPATSSREHPTKAEVVPFPRTPQLVEQSSSPSSLQHVAVSSREGEILRLLVDGASNKTIAQGLRITEATVKVHLRSLFRKLGVTNRTQAAIWGTTNSHDVSRTLGVSLKLADG